MARGVPARRAVWRPQAGGPEVLLPGFGAQGSSLLGRLALGAPLSAPHAAPPFPPQLYDFASPEEAPRAVAFHPMQPTFFCGFSSGAVRSFSLEAAEVLVEHRWAPRRACPTDTRGGRLAGVWTPWESPPSAAPGHPVSVCTPFRVGQVSPRSHHRPGHQPRRSLPVQHLLPGHPGPVPQRRAPVPRPASGRSGPHAQPHVGLPVPP